MNNLQVFNVAINQADLQDDGQVLALVAHMEKRNANGNVYQTGSIGKQTVMISEWNHSAVASNVTPVTYGEIEESDGEVFLKISYDMTDPRQASAFRFIRNAKELEWSIGINVMKSEYVMGWNEDDEFVANFTKTSLAETSPVWAGADPETKTISINLPNMPKKPEPEAEIPEPRRIYTDFLVNQARRLLNARC